MKKENVLTTNQVFPLWSNIFKSKVKENDSQFLKRIMLFKDLSDKELEKLIGLMFEREYQNGEKLFEEDNPGAGMFIIKSGKVVIKKNTANGGKIKLAELIEGDFFGEVALLTELDRTASAESFENTKVFAFMRHDFIGLIKSNPTMGSKILIALAKIVGERLIESNRQLAEKTIEKTSGGEND